MLPKSEPAARKVYLAIAGHYAQNDLIFVQSLLALSQRTQVAVQFGWSADPSVERARNILTANFLETDCTHILFVDADIGFLPEHVARISSHHEPIVGGMYPLKNMEPTVQWCGNGLDGTDGIDRTDGLVRVSFMGTGFLCVAREVLVELRKSDGEQFAYRQDFPPHRREYAYWRQGVAMDRFLTEDWMFCHRAALAGYQIFADRAVVLRHAGRAEWPLPLQSGNPFLNEGPQ